MCSKKSAVIYMLLLLAVFFVKAQVTAPDKAGYKLTFEKVYLHTDRDIYAQGDTLWFKAYLVNGQDPSLNVYSGNLYVQLIAKDSARIVNHQIIKLNNSTGYGEFALADPQLAGQYTLRAYTNWMRNFGDNFAFEKEVTIINTSQLPLPIVKTITKIKKPVKAPAPPAVFTKPLAIQFYPEGGSMIAGISSIIAVKAQAISGKGMPVSGVVVSSSGDTLTRFTCDSLGLGMFTLMPAKGLTYRAITSFNKKLYAFNLPPALAKGMAMQVRQSDSLLFIAINVCNDSALGIAPLPHSLTIKHAGVTLLLQNLQALQTAVKVPTATLPEGIAAITLYDEQNHPNCERLVYIHHPAKATLRLATNKSTYQPREAVTMQIKTAPHADLSLAAVDASTIDAQGGDILSYLMLQSEIKGTIENMGRYFDTTNVNRFKQLNLLLLTQGWRNFVWRSLADEDIRLHYPAEDGITVSGYVRDEVTKKPIPGLNITLYASGAKGQKMFGGHTDSTGKFSILGLPLDGVQNIKLSSVNNKGKTKGSFYMDTLSYLPVQKPLIATLSNKLDTLLPGAKALSQKFEKAKNAKGTTNLKEVKIRGNKIIQLDNGKFFMPWGNEEEFIITPKDYELKTVTWYVLNHSKTALPPTGEKPGVEFVIDGKKSRALMIVNGSTWHLDEELYYNMPLEKIKRIQIREVAVGRSLRYLLYITTKENALWDNPGSLNLSVEGYYQAKTFYKPVYDGKTTTLPDLRSTIHWEPNVKTNAAGLATVTYYNADVKTNIRVIVQGITDRGLPVTGTITYQVK